MLGTEREIFSTNVIFPIQCNGLVQIFNYNRANIIKLKKNLNYLVKPHERFPYGFLFIVMAFFGKNPICNTVEASFSNTWLFFMFSLLFTKKSFHQKVLKRFFQVLSVGLCKKHSFSIIFHQKRGLYFNF